jgi:opacity protein-like surface antigen
MQCSRSLLPSLLVVALVLAPAAAFAQAENQPAQPPPQTPPEQTFNPLPPEPEGFSITPFFGAGFGGDFQNRPATSGVALGYGANDRISLEAEFGIAPGATQGSLITFDTRAWTLSGNVLYHFARPQLTPYVVAGVGLVSSHVDTTPFDLDIERSTTGFALNFGGGVKTALNDRLGLRGDLRYFNASDAAPDHWRITAGLVIRRIGQW